MDLMNFKILTIDANIDESKKSEIFYEAYINSKEEERLIVILSFENPTTYCFHFIKNDLEPKKHISDNYEVSYSWNSRSAANERIFSHCFVPNIWKSEFKMEKIEKKNNRNFFQTLDERLNIISIDEEKFIDYLKINHPDFFQWYLFNI